MKIAARNASFGGVFSGVRKRTEGPMDDDLIGHALFFAFVAVVAFLLWLALTSCSRTLPPEPGYVMTYARDAGR